MAIIYSKHNTNSCCDLSVYFIYYYEETRAYNDYKSDKKQILCFKTLITIM